MPNTPHLVANDLVEVLKKKHAMGTYKEMVTSIELVPVLFVVGNKY